MTGVVESTYKSPDSDLATQVAKLWPHRECEANIILGNYAASGCTGGVGWIYQDLSPAKKSAFAFHAKK